MMPEGGQGAPWAPWNEQLYKSHEQPLSRSLNDCSLNHSASLNDGLATRVGTCVVCERVCSCSVAPLFVCPRVQGCACC
jgi:hypothetical protein